MKAEDSSSKGIYSYIENNIITAYAENPLDFIDFVLSLTADKGTKRYVKAARKDVKKYIYKAQINKEDKGVSISYELYPDLEDMAQAKEIIDKHLSNKPFKKLLLGASLMTIKGRNVYVALRVQFSKIAEVEKLHKQPRGYLKTTAKLVGKATDEKTLFSLPEVKVEGGGNLLREVISRNTAILGNYLLQLWQQNGGGELVINNLSPIAEIMGNSNYEIKIYLLYLGGYVYPIVDVDEKGLSLTTEQLFKVKFRYSSEVAEKYKAGNITEIGSGLLTKFIKDEPIDSITIEPSPLFIKAMEGKGLGNVLVVNDKFVKLALSLTDIAYKIFTYSASSKPSQKIGEDNLVKHLGLEKQIRTQGRPRVRATILKGLQELQDKEHIKSYSYEEATGMYLFTYSDKYVRHQELKKG